MPGITGIQIGGDAGSEWVHAVFQGKAIAGVSFRDASHYPDGGARMLWSITARFWGPDVASEVVNGGVFDGSVIVEGL